MNSTQLKATMLALLIGLAQGACQEDPKDGEDGKSNLIKIIDISADKPECINGARRYIHYRDANANGKLDAGEETDSFESCDKDAVAKAVERTKGQACDANMISEGQTVFPMSVGHHPASKSRIQAVFPGRIDYTTNKIIPLVPGENLFVCEDDLAIATTEYRIGTVGFTKVQYDIVFIVDNSDSMKNNWTAIKEQLKAYTNQLDEKQIDYKIAVIGYNENSNVTGAINLGDAAALSAFLEVYGGSVANGKATKFIGKDRDGKDFDLFEANLNSENGIPAIMYARDRLSFRKDSQRVYINVTNEFLVDDTPKPVPAPAPAPTTDPAPAPTTDPAPAPTTDPAPAPTTDPAPAPTTDPAPAPTTDPAPAPTTLALQEAEKEFVPDSSTPYTPEKFCPTWKLTDGFIHTIWMGDVLTNKGVPVKNDKGEYTPYPFDFNSGSIAPTVLTSPTCGRGIRQVMQHEYAGNPPYENPAPRQEGIPELDFTKLMVTDSILESSMVIFKTLEPSNSHKLQIFIKGADGAFSKGEFSGNYPEYDATK